MAGNLSKPEEFGCKPINPKACRGCVFSRGEAPFEDAPEKRYCMVYTRASGQRKPAPVYHDGADCPFRKVAD